MCPKWEEEKGTHYDFKIIYIVLDNWLCIINSKNRIQNIKIMRLELKIRSSFDIQHWKNHSYRQQPKKGKFTSHNFIILLKNSTEIPVVLVLCLCFVREPLTQKIHYLID